MQMCQSREYASRPMIERTKSRSITPSTPFNCSYFRHAIVRNNDDDVCRCIRLVSFDTAARDDSRDFIPSRVTLSVAVREFQPRTLSLIRKLTQQHSAPSYYFYALLNLWPISALSDIFLFKFKFKRHGISLKSITTEVKINYYKPLCVISLVE